MRRTISWRSLTVQMDTGDEQTNNDTNLGELTTHCAGRALVRAHALIQHGRIIEMDMARIWEYGVSEQCLYPPVPVSASVGGLGGFLCRDATGNVGRGSAGTDRDIKNGTKNARYELNNMPA